MGQSYSSLEHQSNCTENGLSKGNEKENVADTTKQCLKDDPRSPSQRIDRTPLRESTPKLQRNEYKRLMDPRSPCGEISRTPIKGVKTSSKTNGAVELSQRLFDIERRL